MFKKKFMIEVLVNGNPNIASSTEFASYEEALAYATRLYENWDAAQAYRIFECGWGSTPRTLKFPTWISPDRKAK